MKAFYILSISVLGFLSCQSESTHNTGNLLLVKSTPTEVEPNQYFVFDQVDHYSINIGHESVTELLDKAKSSAADSIKKETILGGLPMNTDNMNFIKELEKVGFNKKTIDTKKFTDLKDIFQTKSPIDRPPVNCINIYRDLLVFKQSDNVVGVVKICFDCQHAIIVGTDANVESFGQNGDFQKLQDILK